jgi:hypothetical protein
MNDFNQKVLFIIHKNFESKLFKRQNIFQMQNKGLIYGVYRCYNI